MRWVRGAIIGLVAVLLGACSAVRLGYGQGPALAHWWLDGYVGFTDEQSPSARQAIDEWFAWHRATQLPDYADWLAELQRALPAATDADQVCRRTDQLRSRFEPALARAVPLAAELVPSLSLEQLKQVEKRYAKNNEAFRRDFLQNDPADRFEAALKRTTERFEWFYGTLDDAQARLVADGVRASPFDPQAWHAERVARQREIVRTLRELVQTPPGREKTSLALAAAAGRWQASVQLDPRSAQYRLARYNCEFIARVHNATTPQQRERAAAKLRGIEEDLRALAADAPAPAPTASLR